MSPMWRMSSFGRNRNSGGSSYGAGGGIRTQVDTRYPPNLSFLFSLDRLGQATCLCHVSKKC